MIRHHAPPISEACFTVPWFGSQLSLLALHCVCLQPVSLHSILTTSLPTRFGELFASMYNSIRISHSFCISKAADWFTRAKDIRLRWGGLTSPEGHSELSCFPLPLLDVSQMNTDEKYNNLLYHSVFCLCPLRGKLHCLSNFWLHQKKYQYQKRGRTPVSSTQAHTFQSF